VDLTGEETQAFLAETEEGLAQLDQDFVILERCPADREVLGRAFRVVHNIKGTCAFLGLKRVVALAHAGESLLAPMRDGKIQLDFFRATLLLRMVDDLRRMIASFKQHGEERELASEALIETLLAAVTNSPVCPPGSSPSPPVAPDVHRPMPSPLPTTKLPVASSSMPAELLRTSGGTDSQTALERAAAAGLGDASIRVDLTRLDHFMNLVGELVLVRNQMAQQFSHGRVLTSEAMQRLNAVTGRLQDGVLKVRMQPVGKLWSNLPRVVRDLAASLGKDATLVTEGAETELDRNVIDTIRDPLVHAVRNALDHGLEPPEVRMRAGKPASGRLQLRAWHEGGLVHIAIEDDGAGVKLDRVRSKAVERGLLAPERADSASTEELLELIFLPGFSTASEVTSVSGRGVGMDVVRSALERVGGSAKLTTRAGAGTTLTLSMPLTLAIVSALLVRVAGERYAIPRRSIVEVVRPDGLESFQGLPVLRLRDKLIPICDLGQVLGKQQAREESPRNGVVIVRGDERLYGLRVDEVIDIEEIVVKPLPRWLRSPRAFAGLTILGDGSVAVILDVAGISRRARVAAASSSASPSEVAGPEQPPATGEPVVLLGDGRGGRQAVRLSQVVRIEQVPLSAVEQLDGRPVVQYRGRVLPLYDLCPWAARRDPLNLLVTSLEDRKIALLVDEVLDIALATPRPETTHEGREVVVVGGQVAALQDLPGLLLRQGALSDSTAAVA
jgi:two-component system, chemotaxis family, sensor kinase CheA